MEPVMTKKKSGKKSKPSKQATEQMEFLIGRIQFRIFNGQDLSDLQAEAEQLIQQGADPTFFVKMAQLAKELGVAD